MSTTELKDLVEQEHSERADARDVTAAEGRALGTLLEHIGFAPNVMFGRDATATPLWFRRLVAGKVYALVPQRPSKGIEQYMLYVTTVGANGTAAPVPTRPKRTVASQRRAWGKASRAKLSRTMKARWAALKQAAEGTTPPTSAA